MSKLQEKAAIQAEADFAKGIYEPYRDGGKRYADHYIAAWEACEQAEDEGREDFDLEYFLQVA